MYLMYFLNFPFYFRGITASSPVAVLNAVLNNQSKGVNPLFYKCPSGASSYGLVVSSILPGMMGTFIIHLIKFYMLI